MESAEASFKNAMVDKTPAAKHVSDVASLIAIGVL